MAYISTNIIVFGQHAFDARKPHLYGVFTLDSVNENSRRRTGENCFTITKSLANSHRMPLYGGYTVVVTLNAPHFFFSNHKIDKAGFHIFSNFKCPCRAQYLNSELQLQKLFFRISSHQKLQALEVDPPFDHFQNALRRLVEPKR